MRAAWPESRSRSPCEFPPRDWLGDERRHPGRGGTTSPGRSRPPASTSSTCRRARPHSRRNRSTGACSRPRSPMPSATTPVSPPWRWAISSKTDHVNSIIAAGRADLCCLARPHLMDPNWTLRAAAQMQLRGEAAQCPVQYLAGFDQLQRNLARAADMAINA